LIIVRFLTELLRRIREAPTNGTMGKIILNLRELKTEYQQTIERHWSSLASTDPLNNLETRSYFFAILEYEIDIMIEMFNTGRNTSENFDIPDDDDEKIHDNDFEEISKISIIPTKEEILCDLPPNLPSLSDEHHSLQNGAARLLDRQFRLLREDMLKPIRGGISKFLDVLLRNHYFNLDTDDKLTSELKDVLNKGKFTYNNSMDSMNDNGDLYVYAGMKFTNIGCDRRNGLFCTLKFASTHNPKNARKKKEYWRNGKKLKTSNLVALLLPNPNFEQIQPDIYGNISSNDSELYSLYFGVIISRDEKTDTINVIFNDPSIYPIALNKVSKFRNSIMEYDPNNSNKEKIYMVESANIYFEAYRYVLKTLQTAKPSFLPFKQYLAPELGYQLAGTCIDVKVKPPKYTRAPGFHFDLSVLCNNNLTLNVANTHTYDDVAKNINEYCRLDESQGNKKI
jgi:hypothetical protein